MILGWQLPGEWEEWMRSGDQRKLLEKKWVTISKIAVPLKVGTATAAEMMCVCVCVLTGILDLVFHKCLCVQNINRCIDTTMKKQ